MMFIEKKTIWSQFITPVYQKMEEIKMEMEKVWIDYAEFKRLVAQEINLKNQIATLEEEIQELENKIVDLDCKLFRQENELVEEEELIDDDSI